MAKGADARPDVLRAARQGGGLLQGQGRLDAHRRPRQRQSRRERDRRRLRRNRHGRGFSAKALGTDRVAVCFFGEGALGQGLLYEVMNMASLWKLPVIYVCENNLYNEYTHYLRDARPARSRRAPQHSAFRPKRSTARTCSPSTRRQRAPSSARGAAKVRRSSCARPTAFTVTTSATSTAPTTAPKDEEERWSRERDPIALLAARYRRRGVAIARSTRCTTSRGRDGRGREVRAGSGPIPTRAR